MALHVGGNRTQRINTTDKANAVLYSEYRSRITALLSGTRSDEAFQNFVQMFGEHYEYSKWHTIGGEALLFLALNKMLDRYEIFKIPLDKMSESRKKIARFFRGALVQSKLTMILDFGVPQVYSTNYNPPYVIMEAINGKLLLDYMAGQNDETNIKIFCLLCRLVSKMHKCGVIHRDLKPDNVLVAEDIGVDGRPIGETRVKPVILDYGLAKRLLEDDDSLTSIGAEMGTRLFGAPEQLGDGADAGDADQQSDVHALAVILYIVLTFKKHGLPKLKKNKMKARFLDINKLDAEFVNVFKTGIASRKKRYKTVSKFLADVMDAADIEPGEWLEIGIPSKEINWKEQAQDDIPKKDYSFDMPVSKDAEYDNGKKKDFIQENDKLENVSQFEESEIEDFDSNFDSEVEGNNKNILEYEDKSESEFEDFLDEFDTGQQQSEGDSSVIDNSSVVSSFEQERRDFIKEDDSPSVKKFKKASLLNLDEFMAGMQHTNIIEPFIKSVQYINTVEFVEEENGEVGKETEGENEVQEEDKE